MESGNFVLDLHSSISRVVYLNTEPSGTYLVFDSHTEPHAHNRCLVIPVWGIWMEKSPLMALYFLWYSSEYSNSICDIFGTENIPSC